ncbi:MAG: T9SS type A sorting domain-containing protein, partial [Bacteroidales bacterium]|nr:T9SS type A sorting domain-containing protein [Bacteroidales bacterium]
ETVPYEYGAPYGESFLGITTLVLPDLYGSYYLDQRLTSLDVEHELHTFEGKEHCFYIEGTTTLLPEELDTCFRIALAFMANILFDNPSPEGVSDISSGPFSIFPNPVEDCIYLQREDNDLNFSCELYDMQGKRLIKRENATSINVSSLPAGVYVLQINTANGSQFHKIIKK